METYRNFLVLISTTLPVYAALVHLSVPLAHVLGRGRKREVGWREVIRRCGFTTHLSQTCWIGMEYS